MKERADLRVHTTSKDLATDMMLIRNLFESFSRQVDSGDLSSFPHPRDLEHWARCNQAIIASLRRRGIQYPTIKYDDDPLGYFEVFSNFYEITWPLVAAGHLNEAKKEAEKFVTSQ